MQHPLQKDLQLFDETQSFEECNESIHKIAKLIMNDTTDCSLNKLRNESLLSLLMLQKRYFNELERLEHIKFYSDHNASLGFNPTYEFVKNNPGEIAYFCEFCGMYKAAKPQCNKCEE